MSDGESDPTQWNFMNPILDVSDVRRSQAYYRDVLGMTPSWIWEDRIGGVFTGSLELYLSRSREPSPSRIAVFVDDADAAYERYRAAGAEIADEIETMPWGLRSFTVRDPDRNLIGIAHEEHSPEGRPEYDSLVESRSRA